MKKNNLLLSSRIIRAAAVLCTAIILLAGCGVKKSKKITDSSSTLKVTESKEVTKITVQIKEIVNMAKLSVVEYPYSGIAEWYDEETQVGYVKYEGTVKIGIDFDDIEINADETAKNMEIIIPKSTQTSYSTDTSTMEFIYMSETLKKQYEKNSDALKAIYKVCEDDLIEETGRIKNEKVYENADRNLKNIISMLTETIAEAEGYSLSIIIAED